MRILFATIFLLAVSITAQNAHADSSIAVSDAWIRATVPTARAAAAYVTITNDGDEADQLTAVSSEASDRVELHKSVTEDNVTRMQKVESIEIAAGKSVTLVPGGEHIMLIGLKQPLKIDQQVKLQLTFAKAGVKEATATVRAATMSPEGLMADRHHE